MSDGLIMKGSPPSSGRRTSAKQQVNKKKAPRRGTSSTTASNRAPVKVAAKARPVAAKGKTVARAVASAGQAVSSKIAKQAQTRRTKASTAKPQAVKGRAAKTTPQKSAVAKAPKIPAKAGTAKAAKVNPTANTVKRAAMDDNSGVNMKGNSTPDKTGKAGKTGADRQSTGSTVLMVKPQTVPAKIVLPENYKPTDSEPFMNPVQRHYFRLKLLNWKEDILRQTRETLQGMHEDNTQYADLADRATSETDRALELRARDRQRKLISKIDAALSRIEDGTYGYCEETGEPIGLKRLDARPIATLSLEAQERHERRERVHRGD
jgi:DnaK suppressor protein